MKTFWRSSNLGMANGFYIVYALWLNGKETSDPVAMFIIVMGGKYYSTNWVGQKFHLGFLEDLTALVAQSECSPSGFSVHGILQARILEWVAIPFSRGSSPPRDRNHLLHCRQSLYSLSQHHIGMRFVANWMYNISVILNLISPYLSSWKSEHQETS